MRVFNVPIGVNIADISHVFEDYGEIMEIKFDSKEYHGINIDTGKIFIYFSKITTNIPSYVEVRGWNAYVYYAGQLRTCRICGEPDHLGKDCPDNRTPGGTSRRQQSNAQEPKKNEDRKSTDMDVQQSSETNDSPSEVSVQPGACQEILTNLDITTDTASVSNMMEDQQIQRLVEEDDHQNAEKSNKQSQAWADSVDEDKEISVSGSEKPQETLEQSKLKIKVSTRVRPKPYCPNCRMDSHTEEKCGKVTFCKLPNKRKFGRLDSKPGKGELVAKKRKNFAFFKADLESIVCRGNQSSDIQYVMEMCDGADETNAMFAIYLVSRFGKKSTALTARNIFMKDNEEVMTLWSKYSNEGMSREDAREHLLKCYELL